MATTIEGDLRVTGAMTLLGVITPRTRAELIQENLAVYPIPLTQFRVWDAIATVIPGTSASDDIGISGGTWGTHAAKLTTGDVKTTTVARYARVQVPLPVEYVAGQTVTLRISAAMETTVADGSATVDAELYVNGRDGTIDGSDLITTAATNINTLSFANRDFQMTCSGLLPGDELDIRLKLAVVDAATATAVIASIGSVQILCDVKG